jgi:hypothetical protein
LSTAQLWWPSPRSSDGRQRAVLVSATAQELLAIDTRVGKQSPSARPGHEVPQRHGPEAAHRSGAGHPDGLEGIDLWRSAELERAERGSRRCTRARNSPRISSERFLKRRSQPRVVSGATPAPSASASRVADSRWRAASASPITEARSRRRSRATTGNKTWVIRHDLHRARRGRMLSQRRRSRNERLRAWPPTIVRPTATEPGCPSHRLILLPDLLPDRPTRGTTSRHRPSAGKRERPAQHHFCGTE